MVGLLLVLAGLSQMACKSPDTARSSPMPSVTPLPLSSLEPYSLVANARDDAPSLEIPVDVPVIDPPEPLQSEVLKTVAGPLSADPRGITALVGVRAWLPISVDPQAIAVSVASISRDPACKNPEPTPEPTPIQVSKEVFNQTFTEVEALINNLNSLIKERNYSGWTRFLSPEYLAQMSRPDYLRQLSQSATLQKNNIVLKNLEDYFKNVVGPSRANLRLDDLVFLTENVVEAIMVIGNRRVTVYRLIKVDNQWMIGLS